MSASMGPAPETSRDVDQPLAGYTIAVTAVRRREELASVLEKRGARVVSTPTFKMAPLESDAGLKAATRRVLENPVDVVVATTGVGFRRWLESADGWGMGEALHRHLASTEILARGPKARGAIRHAGLTESWCPESESVAEVFEHLRSRELTGVRIAIQLYGEALEEEIASLAAAGAQVETLSVYRWLPPDDTASVARLVRSIVAGEIDGVVFTSQPAVSGLLVAARGENVECELLNALTGTTVPVCVGPICAQPLDGTGVTPVLPEQARTGSLLRAVVEHVPRQRALRISHRGRQIEIRGHAVVDAGVATAMQPAPMAILRALAESPGTVISRDQLAERLPGPSSGAHAVEMAITRLRAALPDPDLVETVVKRGYRLATG